MTRNVTRQDTSSTVRGWLLVAAGFLGMLPVWGALVSQYVDARDAYTDCAADAPTGATLVGDTYRFAVERTSFPAGRQCIYDMQDGTLVTTQSGWTPTIWAIAGTVVCVAAVVVIWLLWRRTAAMQRLLVHVALVFAALGWVSIAWFASLG
ncbi:hypothetical protein [Microbacterium sp. 4-7]|uniref:hypothetical protein n=1 Tax=Microbacterium sp. 4-7 TaxID=1885327 RepID=UPI00164FB78D|nr:hypothetical protein [Microbacterium sp. 4-7]MBC6495410.1 hypothetical protein [Microbacterium sp. 4-7]